MSSGQEETDAASNRLGKSGHRAAARKELTPSDTQSDCYNFDHTKRGLAVIINNKIFDMQRTGQKNRPGTDTDASALESIFVTMGFDVHRHDNLTALDMSIKLREYSKLDHSDSDCFVCVILSHGKDGYVYGTNGTVKIEGIVDDFKGDNCSSLAGKPKIFFIQACRGSKFDWGAEVADSIDDVDSGAEGSIRKVPIEADVMMAYSVVPGYFSWRNNVDGSWFVQAIVKIFRQYHDTMELNHMLTLVNKTVALDFASCTDDDFTSNMRQVPCFVSTLTKFVYFKPKY